MRIGRKKDSAQLCISVFQGMMLPLAAAQRTAVDFPAQEIRKRMKEASASHKHWAEGNPIGGNIFDHVLYCGVCGKKMTRHSYAKTYADGHKGRLEGYFCLNGGQTKTGNCPESNRISNRELERQEKELEEKQKGMEKVRERYLKAVRSLLKLKDTGELTMEMVDSLTEKIHLYPGKRVETELRYTNEMLEGWSKCKL